MVVVRSALRAVSVRLRREDSYAWHARQLLWQPSRHLPHRSLFPAADSDVHAKTEGEVPQCMVRAENLYNFNNKPMILMNCYDAVMQNDAREIFFLDKLMIRQWADWMCVAPQKPLGNNVQFIVSQQCEESEQQQFIIYRMGKVASRSYSGKCLAAQDDNKVKQVQSYGFVSVSGTIGDSRSNPYNVVDPNGYGWWAPPLDVSHAFF